MGDSGERGKERDRIGGSDESLAVFSVPAKVRIESGSHVRVGGRKQAGFCRRGAERTHAGEKEREGEGKPSEKIHVLEPIFQTLVPRN